jgi:hypothetical protein
MKNASVMVISVFLAVILLIATSGCTDTQRNAAASGSQTTPSPTDQVAATATSRPATNAVLTYENASAGIRLSYPEGWTVREGGSGSTVAVISAPFQDSTDRFRENIEITAEVTTMPLDAYVDAKWTIIKQEVSNFNQNMDTVIKLKTDNSVARKIGYSGKMGALNMKWFSVFTQRDTMMYTVTFTAEAVEYQDYVTQAEAIFNSIAITKLPG